MSVMHWEVSIQWRRSSRMSGCGYCAHWWKLNLTSPSISFSIVIHQNMLHSRKIFDLSCNKISALDAVTLAIIFRDSEQKIYIALVQNRFWQVNLVKGFSMQHSVAVRIIW